MEKPRKTSKEWLVRQKEKQDCRAKTWPGVGVGASEEKRGEERS